MNILDAIRLGAFLSVVLGTVAAVFGLAYAVVWSGMKAWEKRHMARQSKRRAAATDHMKGFYSEELLKACPDPQKVADRLFPKYPMYTKEMAQAVVKAIKDKEV